MMNTRYFRLQSLFFWVFIFLVISSGLRAQLVKRGDHNLVVGTYTSSGKSIGIYVYRFNAETGNISPLSAASGIKNPSYLTISKDGSRVYAVGETEPGTIHAFGYSHKSGKLSLINTVLSGGDDPCYITVDDARKFVYVANYSSGSLSAVPLLPSGGLSATRETITHTTKGVDPLRQQRAHVHSTVLSPDQKQLFSADLGTDSINYYSLNSNNNVRPIPLIPSLGIKVRPGSGPRHLLFHPNGKVAYLIQEMKSVISVYDYTNQTLIPKQIVEMLDSSFKGVGGAADIHISPDGKFLYASNRGTANELVIYKISVDGMLTTISRQSVMGKTPRNFAIDPSGKFLLVANQGSDEIVVFKRNAVTGLLSLSNHRMAVGSPVCLRFD